jgi:hypothetical protein
MSTNYTRDFKEIVESFIVPAVESFKPEFESNGYNCSFLEQSESQGISYKLTATQRVLVSYILNFHLQHPEADWVVCSAKQDNGIINAFINEYPLNHLKSESNVTLILKQALIRMQSVR